MIVTCDQRPEYFEFASQILQANYSHGGECKVITQLHDDGYPAAVAVYSRFHETNLEMSIASDGSKRWINKAYLYACFAYPFNVLGKRRIMGVVEEGNEAAMRLDLHLGFVEEGRLRKWFGEKDGILLGMLREECRWLKRKNNV